MINQFPDVSGLDLQAAAVAYARAGLFVGPTSADKRPGDLLGRSWQHKTSNDPVVVRGWFDGLFREDWYRREAPIEGIFLHVGRSGLVCFDVDQQENIPDLLAEAERDHPTAVQYTRPDGSKRHLIYRTDKDLGNSRGALGKGWGDVRGKNGVIILAPTPHSREDGEYRWVSRVVEDLPDTLAEALTSRLADPFAAVTGTLTTPVPLGARDDEMFRYACRLRRMDLAYDEALALLRVRAEAFDNADGKVNERFLRDKLDNAWRFPAGTAPQIDAPGFSGAPEGDEAFWTSRKELEHLRTFALARRVAPWAVLGVTLARVLCALPPSVVLPPTIGSRASLNTFVALAGGSGDSKTTSAEVSFDALRIEGEEGAIPLGSGEGIPAMFVQFVPKSGKGADAVAAHYEQYRTRAFVEVDEIATMGAIGSRGGSTLGDTLRKAWSGRVLGNHNRAVDTRLIVAKHAYRLCMWVGVQPSASGILLNEVEEGLGTPQRFLWIKARRDVNAEGLEAPAPLHWSLPALPDTGDDAFADEEGWSWEIPLCEVAVRDIIAADKARASGDESDSLNGHLFLCRVKVATAFALLDGRWSVNEEDWSLAGSVMEHSNACRTWLKGHLSAEAVKVNQAVGKAKAAQEVVMVKALEEHATVRVGRKVLKLLANGPISESALRRGISSRDRELLPDVLDRLADRVEQVDVIAANGNLARMWQARS